MIKSRIIRFANLAHEKPNPWVRRSALILALLGLIAYTVVCGVGLVIFALLDPFLSAVLAFFKALYSIPRSLAHDIGNAAEEWSINLEGARRIWRSQKPAEPPQIIRKSKNV